MTEEVKYWQGGVTDIPIYPLKLITVVSNCGEYVNDKLGTTGTNFFTARCCTTVYKNHKTIVIMFNPYATEIKQSVIAHECFHAVTFVMDYIGHYIADCQDEPHAYLIQWLMEEVNKKLQLAEEKLDNFQQTED